MTDRELDVIVAKKVMGIRMKKERIDPHNFTDRKVRYGYALVWPDGSHVGPNGGCFYGWGLKDSPSWFYCPKFSTDISAAWQVVEKVATFGTIQITRTKGHALCFIRNRGNLKTVKSVKKTVPLSICVAALAAVGHEAKEGA